MTTKQETERLLVLDAKFRQTVADYRKQDWFDEDWQALPDDPKLAYRAGFNDAIACAGEAPDMADHIRTLQARCDELEKLATAISRDCNNTALERNEAMSRVHELEKDASDAARYRWLRDPLNDVALVLDKQIGESVRGLNGEFSGYNYEYRSGDDLDNAIDTAMKESTHD